MKKCISCLEEKSLDDFYLRTDTNKYRNQCKKCRQEYVNLYKRENEYYKKKYNEYRKQRRIIDSQFAIMDRLRSRVRKMLKAKDGTKYINTIKLLGCTFDVFKEYIIKQFYGNMSWDKLNFVLDHKIPCCWFNLNDKKHQLICFNYKNIQPLTFEDNSKKSDKVWVTYNINKNPYI